MKTIRNSNQTISVLIEARNEAEQIEACIESAKLLTDSVVLIDMESTDNTSALAKKAGVLVYSFPKQRYVEPAREFGIRKVENDWVLILDADERISQELADEIQREIQSKEYTHFQIPRKNVFGPQWLKNGGWWPDYQMRLIKLSAFNSWPTRIHATPLIQGESKRLMNPIVHYFHGDFEQMVQKTAVFEDIESELLLKAGRAAGTPIFFRKFLGEFTRRMIFKRGFQDGKVGIMESIYQAFSKTVTYLYLYEKKKSRTV